MAAAVAYAPLIPAAPPAGGPVVTPESVARAVVAMLAQPKKCRRDESVVDPRVAALLQGAQQIEYTPEQFENEFNPAMDGPTATGRVVRTVRRRDAKRAGKIVPGGEVARNAALRNLLASIMGQEVFRIREDNGSVSYVLNDTVYKQIKRSMKDARNLEKKRREERIRAAVQQAIQQVGASVGAAVRQTVEAAR